MPAARGIKLKHRELEGAGLESQIKANGKRALLDRVWREEEVLRGCRSVHLKVLSVCHWLYEQWKSVIGGMMAGVIGQFLANPTDLVKVQMQMEGKRKLEGKPLRGLLYKSSTDCLIQAVHGEGFMSLYKGFLPSWLRMVKLSILLIPSFFFFLYLNL
ncbi:Mitochondrial uncoupling protein 4 [Sciurus carolinensis]|uniref:Mitochondrial uncoupling protein 4 n=1 Tax=Sciurus carolinensis TaxID=30640 RepID=A0AA41SVD8_SCICA|nr:Mitochondrial uncoupling protein 4 [Sciurus carolinensis]